MGTPDYLHYTFNIGNSTEISRSIRSGERPPAHYKLEVNSFSVLSTSLLVESHFLESTEFSVGGYRWVLQIYPCGNLEDNGEGHISIYLKLCDKLRHGFVINAVFRALVYDQERNKYLVIQDVKEKNFDATNVVRGISRALSQAELTAECNGFLVQDRCTFGAEVFITNTTTPISAKVSYLNSNLTRTYVWRIERFSELSDVEFSPEFTIEGRTWKLSVYPRGIDAEKGKSLSLYLNLTQFHDLTAGIKLHTEFVLRIKNQLNGEDRSRIFSIPFYKSQSDWGNSAIVSISDLSIPSKGLLMDDVMIIEVSFKRIFMLKNV